MKREYKYYTLSQLMKDYQVQDITNLRIDDPVEFNKRYCVVNRNLIIDYLEFRNVLESYGMVGKKSDVGIVEHGIEFQKCEVKESEKDRQNN